MRIGNRYSHSELVPINARLPASLAGNLKNLVDAYLLLDLDLDIDACWHLEALQRFESLRVRLDDVDEAFVDPHFEVLAAVLVLVRPTDHAVLTDLRWERHRATDLRLGANHSLNDLLS